MRKIYWKYFLGMCRVIIGCSFCALGTVFILRGDLGLNPWTILNQGISIQTGLTLGQAGQLFSFSVLIVCLFFKVIPGIGTCINMYTYGAFLDFYQGVVKFGVPESLFARIGLFLLGTAVFSFGTYFYLSSCLGAGPKDGLMVILIKHTPLDVAVARMILEAAAVIIGILLGGSFGIGSLFSVMLNGPLYRTWCRLFHFDTKTAHQENVVESICKLQGKNKGG